MTSVQQVQAIYEEAAAALLNRMVREPDAEKRVALRDKIDRYRREALEVAALDLASRRQRLIDLSVDLRAIVTDASKSGVGGALAQVRDLAEEVDALLRSEE